MSTIIISRLRKSFEKKPEKRKESIAMIVLDEIIKQIKSGSDEVIREIVADLVFERYPDKDLKWFQENYMPLFELYKKRHDYIRLKTYPYSLLGVYFHSFLYDRDKLKIQTYDEYILNSFEEQLLVEREVLLGEDNSLSDDQKENVTINKTFDKISKRIKEVWSRPSEEELNERLKYLTNWCGVRLTLKYFPEYRDVILNFAKETPTGTPGLDAPTP